MKFSDCIVVGGGVIGMLTARELALNGMQVCLIERDHIGQQCSWAGGGLLSPLYPWQMPDVLADLAIWSQAEYPVLCDRLEAETGIDPEWIQSGLLLFDNGKFPVAQCWAKTWHRPLQLMSGDQLIQLEPALHHQHGEAILLPDVAQVRNPILIKALKKSLLQLKVTLYESTEVTELLMTQGRVIGINTSNAVKLKANSTIIANGAWSSQLSADIPVYPVKGQMLCFKTEPDLLHHILLQDGNYIIPRKDGHLLAGSTLENSGFNKDTTDEVRHSLLQFVSSMLPALDENQIVAQWSGLRPATQSGLPCIGSHPELEGLYINTGHYRNGILLAPGSARLLADIVLKRPSFMANDSFCLQSTLPPKVSGIQKV